MYQPQQAQTQSVSLSDFIVRSLNNFLTQLSNDHRIPYNLKQIFNYADFRNHIVKFSDFAIKNFIRTRTQKLGYQYQINETDIFGLVNAITVGYIYDLLITRDIFRFNCGIQEYDLNQIINQFINIQELNVVNNHRVGYQQLKDPYRQYLMNQNQQQYQPVQPQYNIIQPQPLSMHNQGFLPQPQFQPMQQGLPIMNQDQHNTSFRPVSSTSVLGQMETLSGIASGSSYQIAESPRQYHQEFTQQPPVMVQQPINIPNTEPVIEEKVKPSFLTKLKIIYHDKEDIIDTLDDDKLNSPNIAYSVLKSNVLDHKIDLNVFKYPLVETFIWPKEIDKDITFNFEAKSFSEFIYYLDNLIETSDKNNSIANFKDKLDFIMSREFSMIFHAYRKLELNKLAPKLYSGVMNKGTWENIIQKILVPNDMYEYIDHWMLKLSVELINNILTEEDDGDNILSFASLDEYWIYANRVIIPDSIKDFITKIKDDDSDSHSLLFTTAGVWTSESVYTAINEIYTTLESKLVLPRLNLIDKNLKTYSIYPLGATLNNPLPKRFVIKPSKQ